MDNPFVTNKHFKNEDYSKTRLRRAEYQECIFDTCQFQNGYLDNHHFTECEFLACDLSNTNIKHTIFNDVVFKECKLIGLRFEDLNDSLLSLRFDNCQLDFASFFQLRLKNTLFKECSLLETDFTEADLTSSSFPNCNLDKTIFDNTILTKVDFTSALNLVLNPENNQIKKARFSVDSVMGLLKKYDIVIE
ncbi:pentapeptide repeat-containing protein [Croceitalea sp. MTPC9]|uniref:pentapeptide repeat-containing protein n=1 Tax=unclassified Croceitalea TaxID=2632280 RepID=UPI002B3E8F37|nr:pentapeptide repeat-containing protein [Croceitalea sp. MTPC6]GMN18232.1 pentapeptide repeat-containing protein [Croceitalea sp. MTPC9]